MADHNHSYGTINLANTYGNYIYGLTHTHTMNGNPYMPLVLQQQEQLTEQYYRGKLVVNTDSEIEWLKRRIKETLWKD